MKNLHSYLAALCLLLSSFSTFATVTTCSEPPGTIQITLSITQPNCINPFGGSIFATATGGTSPYNYLWSTGFSGSDPLLLVAGTYTVTVTDVTGMTATASATLTDPDPILLDDIVTDAHFGSDNGSIQLTLCGGTPQYSFQWSTGSTTMNLTNLSPGTYTVTVYDGNGCSAVLSSNVSAINPNGPIITAQPIERLGCTSFDTLCTVIVLNAQPGYIYQWTGPGGLFSTSANPFVCLPGYYSVTVTDILGATASKTFIVREKITALPLKIQSSNPAFCTGASGSCEQICPNTTVTYTAELPNNPCGPVTYNWEVYGAKDYIVSTSGASITVSWGEAGNGQVSVKGSSKFYCYPWANHCVRVVEEPEARFATSPAIAPDGVLRVCKGQSVWFENQSLKSARYEWLFSDDLSGSTAEDVQHTFSQPGLFQVQLISQSQCFCADTTLLDVEVLDTETPLIECVGTICPGETITYTTPSNCTPFIWSVSANGSIVSGGGPTDNSITVQWLSGPDGLIELLTANCGPNTCPEPASLRVPVLSDEAKIEGPQRVCPGTEASYSIAVFEGAFYTWKLIGSGEILEGQGTPRVQVRWGSATNTDNLLIVEYENCYLECSGSDTLPVNVRPPFGIGGPLERCANTSANLVAFIGPGQGVNSNWTLFGPNGSPEWNSPTASTFVNPVFSSGPGLYRILAVPDPAALNNTCSDSAEWKIQVAPRPAKPSGISGVSTFCPDKVMSFAALGVSPLNTVQWQIQNSDSATPEQKAGNPINTAFSAGSPRWIAAQQISADGLGCVSDTFRLNLTSIQPQPISGPAQNCAGTLATYSAVNIPGLDYDWSLLPAEAGVIHTGQGTNKVEIFWPRAGSFELRLSVCGQITTLPITVWPAPQPQPQAPIGVCAGETAVANSSSVFSNYLWKNESGGSISTTETAQIGPGIYALVVTDDRGCRGTAEFTVKEYPAPNLTITTVDPTGFCNNSRIVTMSALTNEDGDYDYEWFRDGVSLGVNQTIYSTNQYGLYTATVTNEYGCTATDGPIDIFEYCNGVCHNPSHVRCAPGTMDMSIAALPECNQFQFQLLPGPNYAPGSARWNFGESGASYLGQATGDTPQFTFPNAGQYLVVLYADLDNGLTCVVIDSVKVAAVADFETARACPGDSTQFKDISTFLPQSGISSWQWNFGNPAAGGANQSADRNAGHLYPTAGDYTVQLTVTALSGCTSTHAEILNVPALPQLSFSPQTALCAGTATPLGIVETAEMTGISWHFGDPTSGILDTADGAQVYHRYQTPGTYTATATASNIAGCSTQLSQNLDIVPNLLSGAISPGGASVLCQSQSVTLTAPPVGTTYKWSSGAISSTINVTTAGLYQLTITDASGCTYMPPAKVVDMLPAPSGQVKAYLYNDEGQATGIAANNLTVCAGETVHLFINENINYTYQWSSGGTATTLVFSEDRFNSLSTGTHTFTVTITNTSTGCTAVTPAFVVTVNPKPGNFTVSTDQTCAGIPATVQYNGPEPGDWQFFWNNGETGTSFVTTEPGHYFVRVVNGYGCSAISEKVTIKPGPNVGALPSGCHTRCEPDTLCLPPMPDIVQWQWFFDGMPIAGADGPNLVATQSGVYWAELTDTSGCSAQSAPLSLNLYTGSGDVYGGVWSDVNNNGIIDAGDTLVSGIAINLWQSGTAALAGQSGAGGTFVFGNVPSVSGFVALDTLALSADWEIVIGQSPADLVGCAATAQGHLLIREYMCQTSVGTLNFSACSGTSLDYNGTAIPAGTSQSFTLQNVQGCDSVLTVNVAALQPTAGTLNASACPGTNFNYNGTLIPAGTSQIFTLQNVQGCDSVLTINVAALQPTAGTLNASACPGASFDYNGTLIPAGTSQNFTLQNVQGCDSLLTVNVAALQPTTGTLNASACPGASFDYSGTAIPAGTSQNFTLQNVQGCDSLLTVNVAALQPTTGTLNTSACSGASFDYNGTAIPAGTSQNFTLQNVQGCDSVLTVNVTTIQPTAGTLNASACPGTDFDYNGTVIPAGTSQNFTLQNVQGCDSVLTVNVVAVPAIQVVLQTEKSCSDAPTGKLEIQQSSGGLPPLTYSLDGQNFDLVTLFDDLPAGSHQVWVRDDAGCEHQQTFEIEAIPALTFELPERVLLPCNSTSVTLQATITSNPGDLTYLWWNGSTAPLVSVSTAGPVWLELSDACSTVRENALVVWDTPAGDTALAYVPNVFMPEATNPDNAVFRPYFAPDMQVLEYLLEVYDRWGALLYQSRQTESGWEGVMRGKMVDPGVFVWRLEAKGQFCGREVDIRKKGSVTVVR